MPVLPKFEWFLFFLEGSNSQARLRDLRVHAHLIEIECAICPGQDLIPDWIVKMIQVARRNVG